MISATLAIISPLFFSVAFAELAPAQQLEKRNPYYGGYALAQGTTDCPANTQTCATGFCCPLNTWCSESINDPYCCPTPDDCGPTVADAPTCADPSWTLYMDAYAFCCAGDTVGIDGNQCQPKSLTFSAGLYAATSSQANTALPPSTRASSSVTGTATLNAGSTPTVSTSAGPSGSTSAGAAATGSSSKNNAESDIRGILGTVMAAAGGWLIVVLYAQLW